MTTQTVPELRFRRTRARQLPPLHILQADDGSPDSLEAMKFLLDLPLPEGSSVVVVSVISNREANSYAVRQADLEQIQARLAAGGINVAAKLLGGNPAEQIISYADRHKVDMILIGAKGRRNTPSILLGGVAQQVLEHASTPVMIIRPPYTGLKRILLLVDGSQDSEKALDFIAKFPLEDDVQMRVAHILPPLFKIDRYDQVILEAEEKVQPRSNRVIDTLTAARAQEEEFEGQWMLRRSIQALKDEGIDAEMVLLHGDAATEIMHYVHNYRSDLVVMGARGRSNICQWMLGSLPRKLAHYCNCSILVVR